MIAREVDRKPLYVMKDVQVWLAQRRNTTIVNNRYPTTTNGMSTIAISLDVDEDVEADNNEAPVTSRRLAPLSSACT
jgi:hypothetical protein